MTRVLVTGASGMLGGAVARATVIVESVDCESRTGTWASGTRVNRWTPPWDMMPEPKPNRAGESWFPLVSITYAPASRICARVVLSSSTTSVRGWARSYTSPETRTAETPWCRTHSTISAMACAWTSRMSTPWKVRPRCQSEVCKISMGSM